MNPRAGLYFGPSQRISRAKLGPAVWYNGYGRRFKDKRTTWKFTSVTESFLERIIGPQELTEWRE